MAVSFGDLLDVANVKERGLHKRLEQLMKAGLVEKTSHGEYSPVLPEPPREVKTATPCDGRAPVTTDSTAQTAPALLAIRPEDRTSTSPTPGMTTSEVLPRLLDAFTEEVVRHAWILTRQGFPGLPDIKQTGWGFIERCCKIAVRLPATPNHWAWDDSEGALPIEPIGPPANPLGMVTYDLGRAVRFGSHRIAIAAAIKHAAGDFLVANLSRQTTPLPDGEPAPVVTPV